tara:strand:- start:503 stop:652 length:150 start_codon:yes stop_codon:yes gene_type:complete
MIGLGLKIQVNTSIENKIEVLLDALQARATYYENITCTTATLTALENIE